MALPGHFLLKVAGGKTIEMPAVGFGTWAAGDPGWCKAAVLTALKLGYRHLDCAWKYGVCTTRADYSIQYLLPDT
jgi:diketogulonate reductase-like aldo/keto reductase